MIQIASAVVSNERLSPQCWRLILDASEMASEIKPGQFINVRISSKNFPLFRRPFSVCRTLPLDDGRLGIAIVYRVVGVGTELMTRMSPGDVLDIIGPLGRGFQWGRGQENHVLVAGGIGAAGLLMLAEEISRTAPESGAELYVLLGAVTEEALILEKEFAGLCTTLFTATDDGTRGFSGSVTEMLTHALEHEEIPPDCALYACGPEAMYRSLAPICQEHHIPTQIAMERRMMCGIGACLACVCRVDREAVQKRRGGPSAHMQFLPEGPVGHALVCRTGPVFALDEVICDAP